MPIDVPALQLPKPPVAPAINWAPLSQIGDAVAEYRRKQQIAETLAGATDPTGNLDVDRAGAALAKQGLLEEARPILSLAQQKAQLAQSASQHGASLAEQIRHNQAVEALTKNAQEMTANEASTMPPGSGLYRKKSGEVLQQPSEAGVLDDETVDAMAHQLRAGDTSVLTNLGRGVQGAQNIVNVRKRLREINSGEGETGEQQANRQAEYFGEKAGQRTLGTKQANIEMAGTEFEKVAPLVVGASDAVDRTKYSDVNKIINAWRTRTGDENVVKLGQGLNSLINIYSRAISPTGNPTVHDKVEAQNVIQAAWSKGQIRSVVDFMGQEINAGLESPGEVRKRMRARFLEGTTPGGAAPGAATEPAKPAPAASVPKFGDRELAGYRANPTAALSKAQALLDQGVPAEQVKAVLDQVDPSLWAKLRVK